MQRAILARYQRASKELRREWNDIKAQTFRPRWTVSFESLQSSLCLTDALATKARCAITHEPLAELTQPIALLTRTREGPLFHVFEFAIFKQDWVERGVNPVTTEPVSESQIYRLEPHRVAQPLSLFSPRANSN